MKNKEKRFAWLCRLFLCLPLLLLAACLQDEMSEDNPASPVELQISAVIGGETRAAEKTKFEAGDVISVYLSTDAYESTPYEYELQEDGSWAPTGDNKFVLTTEEVVIYAKYYGPEMKLTGDINLVTYTSAEELKSDKISVSLASAKANFIFKPTQFMVKFNLISFGGDLDGKTYTLQFLNRQAKGVIEDSAITCFIDAMTLSYNGLSFTLSIDGITETFSTTTSLSNISTGHSYVYNIYVPAFLNKSEVQVGDVALDNGTFVRPYTNGDLDKEKAAAVKTYLTKKDISVKGIVYYVYYKYAEIITLHDYSSGDKMSYSEAHSAKLYSDCYLLEYSFNSDYKEDTIDPILVLYGGEKLDGTYWGYESAMDFGEECFVAFKYPGGTDEYGLNSRDECKVRFTYDIIIK